MLAPARSGRAFEGGGCSGSEQALGGPGRPCRHVFSLMIRAVAPIRTGTRRDAAVRRCLFAAWEFGFLGLGLGVEGRGQRQTGRARWPVDGRGSRSALLAIAQAPDTAPHRHQPMMAAARLEKRWRSAGVVQRALGKGRASTTCGAADRQPALLPGDFPLAQRVTAQSVGVSTTGSGCPHNSARAPSRRSTHSSRCSCHVCNYAINGAKSPSPTHCLR